MGKTHLAIALGVVTAELGYRLYFTTALELARKLTTAFAQNRLPHTMKMLSQPKLLIIDEVGYLPLDPSQASMLFETIAKRYEKGVPPWLPLTSPSVSGVRSLPTIPCWPVPLWTDSCITPLSSP